MADTDANCRTQFQTTGALMNAINTGPSIINKYVSENFAWTRIHFLCRPFEVLAISVDLGSITATSDPVVWAVGMTRDPAIGYMTSTGTYQQRSPYWASRYSTPQDAVSICPGMQSYHFQLTELLVVGYSVCDGLSKRTTESGRLGPKDPKRRSKRVDTLCRSRIARCSSSDGRN